MGKSIGPDDYRMPLTGHLGELRRCLFICLGAVAVGMVFTYSFSDKIIFLLRQPVHLELFSLSPVEAFWTTLKVSFFSGLILSLRTHYQQGNDKNHN